MSLQHAIWSERPQLIGAAHVAILVGLLDAWKRTPSPQEPDFVAGLVLVSTPLLWKNFSAILKPYGISFSLLAIYCHQTPKVRYKGITKTSTEMGDLLFVHTHQGPDAVLRRNALLYQAKISSKQPYIVGSSEQHQLKLYTDWPEFEYYYSPPLTGQRRAVTPNAPHSGAQYLLIDSRPPNDPRSGLQGAPNTYPIGSCLADTYLYDHNDLAGELIDFLLARSGRHFEASSSAAQADGWSQLVWDLLRVSIGKAFNRRQAGWLNAPRASFAASPGLDAAFFAKTSSSKAVSTVRELLGDGAVEML